MCPNHAKTGVFNYKTFSIDFSFTKEEESIMESLYASRGSYINNEDDLEDPDEEQDRMTFDHCERVDMAWENLEDVISDHNSA